MQGCVNIVCDGLRVLLLKNHSTKSYFSRLQLRSKVQFTSIHFLQIWQSTIYKRTPFTKCFRIFLCPNAKKINNFGKFDSEKTQKDVIENNNNKTICSCYLSSKWPVCRSIVNQNTGGTRRTKLSTLLKTNIFKYCALFCNKVAKIQSQ